MIIAIFFVIVDLQSSLKFSTDYVFINIFILTINSLIEVMMMICIIIIM